MENKNFSCSLCGKPAQYMVDIPSARKDYKFKCCPRCKGCVQKAVIVYGEEAVEVSKLPEG